MYQKTLVTLYFLLSFPAHSSDGKSPSGLDVRMSKCLRSCWPLYVCFCRIQPPIPTPSFGVVYTVIYMHTYPVHIIFAEQFHFKDQIRDPKRKAKANKCPCDFVTSVNHTTEPPIFTISGSIHLGFLIRA